MPPPHHSCQSAPPLRLLARLTNDVVESTRRMAFFSERTPILELAGTLFNRERLIGQPIQYGFADKSLVPVHTPEVDARVVDVEQYRDGSVYLVIEATNAERVQSVVLGGLLPYVTLSWTFSCDVHSRACDIALDRVAFVRESRLVGAAPVEMDDATQ